MQLISGTRRGDFTISLQLIEDNPEVVKRIMGECIILEARVDLMSDSIMYRALCDQFEELNIGDSIPVYKAVVDQFTVRFEK